MPPSPGLRLSPGRELRVRNHKRGRSLEGGLLVKEKDDDLSLFNEMQSCERHSLLLYSMDDLDDSSSRKLKDLSDLKLGISIPAKGESHDLLSADGEKNDYNWLLTPPDTPLFRSLDDNIPPANLSHGSKLQSQPISIRRSVSDEKTYRTSRSKASSHQLSPSSQSGNTILQSRARSSSTPHFGASSHSGPTMTSQRPLTPQNKTSASARRSPTPTSRQISVRSSGTGDSPGRSWQSPVKASSANSASPKMKVWQSDVSGFFMDSPPNLRTSLSDRPASYLRGSSPVSTSGRGSSYKSGRKSMSPTASRSSRSSYYFDQDQFSFKSKGSIASSGDDTESLLSATTSISTLSASREVGTFPSNRANEFLKKPLRTMSSNSASKRFSDSAPRPMDQKGPQNMFRPLLSSAPMESFYVMKAKAAHCSVMSSSVTKSSNAGSEQGGSVALEGSDQDQDDMKIGRGKAPVAQDELFIFDEVEDITKEGRQKIHDGKVNVTHNDLFIGTDEVEHGNCKETSNLDVTTETISNFCKPLSVMNGDLSASYCCGNVSTCTKCAREFHIIKPMERNDDTCPDCKEKGEDASVTALKATVIVTKNTRFHPPMRIREIGDYDGEKYRLCSSELQENTSSSIVPLVKHDPKVEQGQDYLLGDGPLSALFGDGGQCLTDRQELSQPTISCTNGNSEMTEQELKNGASNVKLDVLEGAGISALVKRPSTSKFPVVQARPFITANVHCDNPSFAGESLNSMRSSIRHCNANALASSSVDLCPSGQMESHLQWQLSGLKADMEHSRSDLNAKPQSCGSLFSGTLNRGHQALVLAKSMVDKGFNGSSGNMEYSVDEEMPIVQEEQGRALTIREKDDRGSFVVRPDFLLGNELDHAENSRTMDISALGLELSSSSPNIQLDCTAVAELPNNEECVSSWNLRDLSNNIGCTSDINSYFIQEVSMPKEVDCEATVPDIQIHGSSVESLGKLENVHIGDPIKQFNIVNCPNSESIRDELQPSICSTPEMNASICVAESSISYFAHDILEELTVTVEGPGHKRSLTLEEATETTLFCRSIVCDLAYLVATISIDRENSAILEGSHPTVTVLDKPNSDRKNPCYGIISRKPTPKPQKKARHRRINTDTEIPSVMTETDLIAHESIDSEVPTDVDSTAKPPKLGPKCNCAIL